MNGPYQKRRFLLALSISALLYSAPAPAKPNPEEMKAGILLFSQVIFEHHPDPYRFHTRAEWDAAIDGLLKRTGEISEAALWVELARLTGMLGDGHSYVWIDNDSALLSEALPIAFFDFDDGLYIRATGPEHLALLGARVEAIGGVQVEEAMERLWAARPGANRWAAKSSAPVLARIPAYLRALGLAESDDAVELRLNLNGTVGTHVVKAEKYQNCSSIWEESQGFDLPTGWIASDEANRARWLARRSEAFWYEYLKAEKAVYFQFNKQSRGPVDSNGNDPWLEFLSGLFSFINENRVERLVIDMRHSGGGDTSMGQALVHHLVRAASINTPGHLFLVIGRENESAAVGIAAEIEYNTHAIFVGEPVGSPPNYYNDPRPWWERDQYHVPASGINFRVSRVVEQRSNYLDTRTTILPDLPVGMSYSDYSTGRDPALDAALEFASENGAAVFVDSDGNAYLEPHSNQWRRSQEAARRD